MKKTIAILTLAIAFAVTAFAHERITIGPKGGRVIYLDSAVIPNVEFLVNKEERAQITLLDKDRKPISLSTQSIVVTAGPRASAKKLAVEKQGDSFVTEKIPAGAPYTVVVQVKEQADSKAIIARVNYNPAPAKSGKPEYLDDSVNSSSGPSIAVPSTLEGLFAELNGHYGELNGGFKDKAYEALDEATQAFTVLLKALPSRSGDKAAVVRPMVDALVSELAVIAEANAARKLAEAKPKLEFFNAGFAALKQNYPAKIAGGKQ